MTDPVLRDHAQFLSRICFLGVLLGAIGTTARHIVDPTFDMVFPCVATAGYFLFGIWARTRHVREVAVAVVLWTLAATLAIGIVNQQLDLSLVYVPAALFVGAVILPVRRFVATNLAAILLVLGAALYPGAHAPPRFLPSVLIALPTMTVIMLVAVRHLERLEVARRAELEESERRLRQRNEQLVQKERSLLRLASAEAAELHGALDIVSEAAGEVLGAAKVALALTEPGRGGRSFRFSYPEAMDPPTFDAERFPGLADALARERILVVCDGEAAPPWASAVREELLAPLSLSGAMIYPVRAEGAIRGIVFFGWDRALDATPELQDAAASIADFVSKHVEAERRRAAERELAQAQKLEAVALLTDGVAHDFNNVLGVMIGYAHLLERRFAESDPHAAKVAMRMRTAGQRAAALVANLLAFSRKQVVEDRDVDLGRVVQELVPILGALVGESVLLDIVVPPAPAVVRIDPNQFEQILLNLATNARQAMPKGGKLSIAVEVASDSVRLLVRDTGTGIPAEILDRIWEPFFTTKTGGTGLGLATVHRITDQHHGVVQVESAIGRGTAFDLSFPRVEHAVLEPLPVSPRQPGRAAHASPTLLVAEDEPMLLDIVSTGLSGLGYRVLTASDGEEALRIFSAHEDEIAAVVLDVVMPKIGGPQALVEMRRRRGDVKAILVSGYAPESPHKAIADATFLPKPYTVETLASRLDDVLDPSSSRP